MAGVAKFVVGHTFNRIPVEKARIDKSGQFEKIYDFVIYLDVIGGEKDVIDSVSFDMGFGEWTCRHPTNMLRKVDIDDGCGKEEEEKVSESLTAVNNNNSNNGNKKQQWRFKSRHDLYGTVPVVITVRGTGGTILKLEHMLTLRNYEQPYEKHFCETKICNLSPGPIPCNYNFYVEIDIKVGNTSIDIETSSLLGWFKINGWEVTSTMGKDNTHKIITLKTPTLTTDDKLNTCSKECEAIINEVYKSKNAAPSSPSSQDAVVGNNANTSANSVSASFLSCRIYVEMPVQQNHDHQEGITLENICNICQNFIKYEDAIDSFLTTTTTVADRNSNNGSGNTNPLLSNKKVIKGDNNKERHASLSSCSTMEELISCFNPQMPPGGQMYKLTLLNRSDNNTNSNGQQQEEQHQDLPMIRFAFGGTQLKFDKDGNNIISDLIRFCLSFVHNTTRFKGPSSLMDRKNDVERQYELLFQYVIKDRYLEKRFKTKAGDANDDEHSFFSALDGMSIGGDADDTMMTVVSSSTTTTTTALPPPPIQHESFSSAANRDDNTGMARACPAKRPRVGEILQPLSVARLPPIYPASSLGNSNAIPASARMPTQPHQPPVVQPPAVQPPAVQPRRQPIIIKRGDIDTLKFRDLGKVLKKLNKPQNRKIGPRKVELTKHFDRKRGSYTMQVVEDNGHALPPPYEIARDGTIITYKNQRVGLLSETSSTMDWADIFRSLGIRRGPLPSHNENMIEISRFVYTTLGIVATSPPANHDEFISEISKFVGNNLLNDDNFFCIIFVES